MNDADRVRKMCEDANDVYGTDLAYVGSYENGVGAGGHIIESAGKRYTGHGSIEDLERMIHAFAGGWLSAQQLGSTLHEAARLAETGVLPAKEIRRILGYEGDADSIENC